MRSFKAWLMALAVLGLTAGASFAGTARNVSIDDALNGRVRLEVAAEGGGVILDFSQTEETIVKLTIDDPSKVGVDHCLIVQACTQDTEPIVRLFRHRIDFPDIPATQTTQLTVITRDAQGQWRSYIFPVRPANQPTAYTKFVIGGTRTQEVLPTTVAVGARVAQSQETLVDPVLKGRLRTYLYLRQRGMSAAKAARKARVSPKLIQRLQRLGQLAQSGPDSANVQPVAQENRVPFPPPLPQSPVVLPPAPPVSSPVVARPVKVTPEGGNDALLLANRLQLGLAVARSRESIRYRGREWYQVNTAIRFLRKHHRAAPGMAEVAIAAGVTEARLREILAMGGLVQ